MTDDTGASATSVGDLTALELADLVGDPLDRVLQLTAIGVLAPDADGRYATGDVHRIRVIDGFEAAGVPMDVLVRAQEAGVISVDYYDQLHAPPGRPSRRDYATFRTSIGSRGRLLPLMFGAFGIAEPESTTHLSTADETFLDELAALVESTGQTDLALQTLRQFGEATRRASVAALETYAEVVERMGPEFAGVPSRDRYERVFLPWASIARTMPAIAEWLTRRHGSRAIDDYSISATEEVLMASGYVPRRPDAEPAIAFLDLTGFTDLARIQGDAAAAEVALRLAELATEMASTHHGRLVKLLGDGVLLHFPHVLDAVEASLALLDRLGAAGLPAGHVGVTRGPIVARDGDVFGRTVNLAARISDVAPSGALYVPVDVTPALEESLCRRAGRCDHAAGRGHRRVGTRRGAQNVASSAAAHRRGVVGAPESDRWCTRATADQYEGAILGAGP